MAREWLVGTVLKDIVPKRAVRSAIRSMHVDGGFVLAGATLALLTLRRWGGRRLPLEDPGPMHTLARATHAALYLLLAAIIGLGIANALVRGASLAGPIGLPQLGDPEWRHPLTHWHGLAANVLMAIVAFHSAAALVLDDVRQDTVLVRMLPSLRRSGLREGR